MLKNESVFSLQTPHGTVVFPVQFDEDFFRRKLQLVIKNYLSIFLPEYFEMRMLRYLDPFELQFDELTDF